MRVRPESSVSDKHFRVVRSKCRPHSVHIDSAVGVASATCRTHMVASVGEGGAGRQESAIGIHACKPWSVICGSSFARRGGRGVAAIAVCSY